MKKSKLKKKIWTISFIVLLVYVTALILKPTIWTALMPIIIPASILTAGIPAYAIIKNTKDKLEKGLEQKSNEVKQIKNNQNTNSKNNNYTNNMLEDYKLDITQETKEKVKTKTLGTIK